MDRLRSRLVAHGVDLSRFGRGKAKSLDHLAAELRSGEAELFEREGVLIRRLAVLNIDVLTDVGGRRRLVEERQQFADGRIRRRSLPCSVAEKLHVGEDPEAALPRALAEELGIRRFTALEPIDEAVESSESPSFPGLLSEYRIYRTAVLIDPSEHREQYREIQADKTTYFVWLPASPSPE